MNKAGEPVKQFFPYQVDSDIRPIYQDVLAPGVVVCHCVFRVFRKIPQPARKKDLKLGLA
jgi:hypothetical protein